MAFLSRYILVGKVPIPERDLLAWAEWFETAERHVARTEVRDCVISTVFLGLDHRFGSGPPLLFETLVFEGPLAGEMDRYETWGEAEEGHAAMIDRVRIAYSEASKGPTAVKDSVDD